MITVYALDHCPYCLNALDLLQKSGKRFEVVWVENDKKDFYKQRNAMNTFPQIFADDIKLGGYDDLKQWIEYN